MLKHTTVINSVIYLVPNDRQARALNALAYRTFEVLLQTGAVSGVDGCSPVAVLPYQIPACRANANGGVGTGGGMDVVVAARPHGPNVSAFTSHQLSI